MHYEEPTRYCHCVLILKIPYILNSTEKVTFQSTSVYISVIVGSEWTPSRFKNNNKKLEKSCKVAQMYEGCRESAATVTRASPPRPRRALPPLPDLYAGREYSIHDEQIRCVIVSVVFIRFSRMEPIPYYIYTVLPDFQS